MNTNTFSIAITQLIWMFAFFWISTFAFWKTWIPDWSISAFLIPFAVSVVYLINVKEWEAWYPLVKNTKSLMIWSLVVIFLVRIMLDYL